jgi:hypothetical protein
MLFNQLADDSTSADPPAVDPLTAARCLTQESMVRQRQAQAGVNEFWHGKLLSEMKKPPVARCVPKGGLFLFYQSVENVIPNVSMPRGGHGDVADILYSSCRKTSFLCGKSLLVPSPIYWQM